MNPSRFWLAVLAFGGLGLAAVAAPAPVPKSQGPISDFLRLRASLPPGAPPSIVEVQGGEETLTVTHRVPVYEQVAKTVAVEVDGRTVQQVVTTTVSKAVLVNAKVALKDCKFFRVSKEGKLEAVAADKAAGLLKKKTAVLTGTSAEVDPRQLELVKPGTLYLVLPDVMNMPAEPLAPPPLPPKALPPPPKP
jgi:hypothetical protein